jgi:hypothetical protein
MKIHTNSDTMIDQVTTAGDFPNDVEYFYDLTSLAEDEEHQRKAESTCCGHVKISSEGAVRAMYPHILGDYKHISSSYYVKPGPKPLFLIQPEPTELVWGYTWGVSPAAEAKWGYIRSGYTASCPTMADQWKFFDRNTKRWEVDTTLQVLCRDITLNLDK